MLQPLNNQYTEDLEKMSALAVPYLLISDTTKLLSAGDGYEFA